MKKAFILFVLSIVFFGCSNDDDMHSMRVGGKLLNQITQTPIPNGKIYYRAFYIIGTGDWATEREISKDSTFTDSAGSFTANLRYKGSDNLIFEFYKPDDEFSTEIVDTKKSFLMEEIKANPNVIFHVRQWETLKVKLKNTSPFDNNDSVSLGFLEDNTSYVNIPIYNIINNGVSNQPWPEETNLLTPYWVGSNIDSEVFVRLQNDTTYSVFWYVRKNGVSSTFHSQMTNTLSGQINLYQINF